MPSTSDPPAAPWASPPAPTPAPAQPPVPPPPRAFPPDKYLAVQAQCVFYGIVSRLPMVARVTVTDYRGNVVYDSLVQPTQPVCDYRTDQTGLQKHHLDQAPSFLQVQQQVGLLIRGKIIVGYALWEFLSVMGLAHPAIDTRDTALFLSFRRSLGYRPRVLVPLAELVQRFMGRAIEQHGDIPVERARAALDLFRSCEQTWEGIIATGAWPCALPPEDYRRHFS